VIAEHRLDRMLETVDRIAYLSFSGQLEHLGVPQSILERLPFGTTLTGAAKLFGLGHPFKQNTLSHLRELILDISSGNRFCCEEKGGELLKAQGISFNYNGITALQEVNLDVKSGEIVGLLGRNGAGKTTLLKCLIGLLNPDRGEIFLNGELVNGRPVSELAKKIAYVPQWPSALLFAETLQDELNFTLQNHGLIESPLISPSALLEKFGLAEVANRYPRDLSAGQRQRAALATVLVTKPEVILMDEPTLGMDPISILELSELLQTWKKEGAGMILATHAIEFVASIADRVIILDQGRVVASGPTSETLFSHEGMRTALQRLTGQPHPASVSQLAELIHQKGSHNAFHRASTNMV